MLRELSNVAIGLLGLHGYPLRPFGWVDGGRDGQRGQTHASNATPRDGAARVPARATRTPRTNAAVGAGC